MALCVLDDVQPLPRMRTSQDHSAGNLAYNVTRSKIFRGKCRVNGIAGRAASEPWRVAVAIPAKNEAEGIVASLSATSAAISSSRLRGGIVLVVNDAGDATFELARTWLLDSGVPHVVVDVGFGRTGSVGMARRFALEIGANQVNNPHAFLLTTDADSAPAPDWIAKSVQALAMSTDVVCGSIAGDAKEIDALPQRLKLRGADEAEYMRLTLELSAGLDPLPHLPYPHHGTVSGANLAFSQRVYRDIGGMPAVPCGEDRAFVRQAEARDWRIGFHDDVRVTTSYRLTGRARGGMADTIAHRIDYPEALCDEMLEPARTAYLRAWSRGRLRRAKADRAPAGEILRALGLDADDRGFHAHRFFGEAWQAIESESVRLRRRPLSPRDLAEEIRVLRGLVGELACSLIPSFADVPLTKPATADASA